MVFQDNGTLCKCKKDEADFCVPNETLSQTGDHMQEARGQQFVQQVMLGGTIGARDDLYMQRNCQDSCLRGGLQWLGPGEGGRLFTTFPFVPSEFCIMCKQYLPQNFQKLFKAFSNCTATGILLPPWYLAQVCEVQTGKDPAMAPGLTAPALPHTSSRICWT